jgi:peptidyl-prolyl cis-trans isomerase C
MNHHASIRHLAIALAAVLACSTPAPAANGGSSFSGTVATIDGVAISAEEVRAALRETDLKHQTMRMGPLDKAREGLERVVRTRLFLADAERSNVLSGEAGDKLRALMNPGQAEIYRMTRVQELSVSPEEMEREAPGRLMEQRKISYMMVLERETIARAWQRALKGEDFAALAREFSEGPGAEKGGDLGYLEKGQTDYFPPEMWDNLFALPVGGITEVFPSPLGGYSFAHVDDIRPFTDDQIRSIRMNIAQQIKTKKVEAEIGAAVLSAKVAYADRDLFALADLRRDDVLASWKGGSVTAGYMRAFMARRGMAVTGMPRIPTEQAKLKGALDELVRSEIIVKELSPALDRYPGYAEGIRKFRDNALVALYVDEIYRPATVTPAEIEKVYRENPAVNEIPERVDLLQMVVETQREAEQVIRRLAKGEDFGKLAAVYSSDGKMRKEAGKAGVMRRDAFPEEIAAVIFALKPGEYSKPVQTRFGWYIFKVLGKDIARGLSLVDRTPEIRDALTLQKKQKLFDDRLDKLKKERKIVIDEKALAKI